MKKFLFAMAMFWALALCSCSENGAKAVFETAKLEETQDNPEHAKKLYRDIIDDYPDSPYAQEARLRLSELEKGQP